MPANERVRAELDFAELVRPHLQVMLRLARRRMDGSDEAMDLVQDALLALWSEPEPPAEPGGWLVRATALRCLQAHRSNRRRLRYETEAARLWTHLRERDEGPAQEMEREELVRFVRATIEGLPDDFRTVVILRDLCELEYRDIAALCGCPQGTVRSRLHRARVLLRERLRGGL